MKSIPKKYENRTYVLIFDTRCAEKWQFWRRRCSSLDGKKGSQAPISKWVTLLESGVGLTGFGLAIAGANASAKHHTRRAHTAAGRQSGRSAGPPAYSVVQARNHARADQQSNGCVARGSLVRRSATRAPFSTAARVAPGGAVRHGGRKTRAAASTAALLRRRVERRHPVPRRRCVRQSAQPRCPGAACFIRHAAAHRLARTARGCREKGVHAIAQ